MHIPKPSKIQTKFISGLLLASIILGIAFSTGFYLHMKNVLEEEVRDKALLIFTHVDSIQHYVRDVLRPTMYERLPSSFVIEAMSSSFISRTIMAPVNDNRDGTIYRRVAIDARNPAYEANEHERDLIRYFRINSEQVMWQGYKLIKGEKFYVKARPVRFDGECMYCHGEPENAPRELIDLYGHRGFGKQLGAIAGVDFVGISVHSSVGRVQQTILTYFAFFALGALLFFSATNVLFRILVVNNLKRLSNIFRVNMADFEGTALLHKFEKNDEIEELVGGMEQMSEHLFEARRQLQDYAENLRVMVDERTDALSREVEARQADVHLFVKLLEDMRQSASRAELWSFALPQICKRFKARGIAYVCTMASQNFYVWPESQGAPELPDDYVDVLTGSACIQLGSRIFVPVESSSGNAEGILCLYWDTEAEASIHDRGVLLALGRQLGTAAENLTAIDSLLRQMNVLETIVEGITDPLALMDASCAVLTVNQAARQLTSELTGGTRTDGNMLAIFFDPVDGNCPMLEAIRRGGPDQREVELPCGRSFSLSMYPVRSQEPRTDRVVVYVRETTMEKRMRTQVWHSEKMATVGKLTAGLAHEINNPLGVILCYAGLLRQSLTDQQQAADLDIIERHTRQAQRVLQELLNFARPKTAGSGTSDACAVAASVCDVFSVQAAKKHVRLGLESPSGPLCVRLGIGELEQVVSNLVINALDAVSEEEGEIVVRVTPGDGNVKIVVEDNGPGVSAQDAPHIFDPFYSTKAIGSGTGLGLAVVYGMVRDVGGEVEVERSAVGGAKFVVTLPAAPPESLS
ncbi:MAG: histidine kinase [Deltaproteobacteria bacterium HGW-Deltaproteobacteria-18]|jgi:signal transduction histidine kinase|nr:MAG: histidine kinase [Deltaproteobacteria bacterium HGW-Deltaproteobacteria-18]